MSKCEFCALCRGAKTVRIEGRGKKESSVLIVTGKPSKEDDKSGSILSGSTGTYLKTLLRTAGINIDDCFFTSAIKCFSDGDDKEAEKVAYHTCPEKWLFREIEIIKPKVIVALGNDAYQILTGKKSVDKDRGSLVVKDFGPISCYVIPVYNPYFLMQQSDKSKAVIQTIEDLRKIPNILNGSFGMWNDSDLKNGKLDYQVIDSVTKLNDIVHDIRNAGVLAADIECRKLDPYRVEHDCVGPGYPFVSLQFSFKEGQAFLLPWANIDFQTEENKEGFFFSEKDRDEIINILRPVLEDPEDAIVLIGHNFKFDSKWIMRWLGITPKLDYDTMVAASFLGEASNRLKKVAWHWTSMGGYEAKQDEYTQELPSEDRWDMFKYPCEVLVPYGCADADATLRIYNQFVKKNIVNSSNKAVFDIIIKASRVFADIENDGIHIDTPYLAKLKEDLTLDLKRVEEEFRMEASFDIDFLDKQIYEQSLGKKGQPLKGKNTKFMISSNDHISRLFYGRLGMDINEQFRSKKTQDASTGSAALKELAPKYPIAGKLLEWRKIAKQISGFVDAYPSFIDFQDRIHPTYSLVQHENNDGDIAGTITGRTACSDPNLQQVPSRGDGKKIKKLFIPDCPDHLFVDLDFAGIELRVAAMHSQDQKMKEFFNSGKGDFHRYAASLIYGIPEDKVSEDPQRRIAKTFNFALLYGAGPMKLSQTAGISLAEAEAFIKEYFRNFPALAEWIKGQHRFAKMYGYVKSMFGRIRYLPDAQLDTRDFGNKIKMEAALKRAVNCVDEDTEILTVSGWKKYSDLHEGTIILTKNINNGLLEWKPIKKMCVFPDYEGDLISLESRSFSALTTPEHEWIVYDNSTGVHKDRVVTSASISEYGHHRIHRTGKYIADNSPYSDDFIELCGWYLTDGSVRKNRKTPQVFLYQSSIGNVSKCLRIESLLSRLGGLQSTYIYKRTQEKVYRLKKDLASSIVSVLPDRVLTPSFISQLSASQAGLLISTMVDGDGFREYNSKGEVIRTRFCTKSSISASLFQMLCVIAGFSSSLVERDMSKYSPISSKLSNIPKMKTIFVVTILNRDKIQILKGQKKLIRGVKKLVWCPQVENQSFVARRGGSTYITKNTPVQADASDLTLYSLGRIWDYLNSYKHADSNWPSRLRGSVHDSILLSVHVNDLPEIVSHIKYNILESPQLDFIISKGVSLRADCSIGPSWGEQTDLDFEGE